MTKKMIINASQPDELRVAITENGRVESFFTEAAAREQTRGNIYKGSVTNIEPSIQAAFINYGAKRNGFLQVGDICSALIKGQCQGEAGRARRIQDLLRPGQEVLVQVVKEETITKGASLTTFFSIPGQYLVLTPGHESQGVSRNISSDAERERIRKALADLKCPEGVGIIARTDAEGRSKREIQNNFHQLIRLWDDIKRRGEKARSPKLIHKEAELAVRVVRDMFTSDVKEILVDNQEVCERVRDYLGVVSPRRKSQVRLYKDTESIFLRYQIEQQIMSVFQPNVQLPCGGSIVIHPTEALVSIDVNSGRAHGGRQIEETALQVNLEAAEEVARQLRLRDLGGLVVIDFIDMRDRSNQRAVRKKLTDELKRDKAKTTVGSISRFGLMEMSRQRIRPPVDFGSTMVCPHCKGSGMVRTPEAVGRGIMRAIEGRLTHGGKGGLRVYLEPGAARYLLNARRQELFALEQRYGTVIELVADHAAGGEEIRSERFEPTWMPPEPPPEPEPMLAEPEKAEPEKPAEATKSASSRRRRGGRRRTKKKDPEQAAEAAEAPAEAPEKAGGEAAPAEASSSEEQPRRRKRRSGASRRKKRQAEQPSPEQQGIVPPGESVPPDLP